MTKANQSFEEKIKLLQISFVNDLPGRLKAIDDSISILDSNPSNADELEKLTRYLHSLAGSGATFGLPAVTKLAREGENLLKVKSIIEQGIDSQTENRINEIVAALHEIKTEKIDEPKITPN